MAVGEIMIEEKFLFPKLKANTFNEAVTYMGNNMNEWGYVNDLYVDAVIKREKETPTGLQVGEYVFAIPHAEQGYVIKQALSIATFESPIKVSSMIQPKKVLETKLMILMAIKDPDKQVQMLSRIMSIFQDVELLKELERARSREEMLRILEKTNLVTDQ